MKRRTNPAASRPRVPRLVRQLPAEEFFTYGEFEAHIWGQLNSASDADGWIFFQVQLFPSMVGSDDLAMMLEWETKFLADRGLSVEFGMGGVSLVKDGDAIAGCSGSFYTSPRVPLAEAV